MIAEDNIRKCKICGKPAEIKSYGRPGYFKIIYHAYCSRHRGYKKYKKNYCEMCGFVSKDDCQIDIHHKDGNNKNNWPSNLISICANCHRLITFQEKHYERKTKNNNNK